MILILEILTGTCLLSGSFLMLFAAIGLMRLPDVLCRSHAVAKAMTLGISLLLIAFWLSTGIDTGFDGLKIVLGIFFQWLTIPISSHLLGLLAWQKRVPRWKERATDHPN